MTKLPSRICTLAMVGTLTALTGCASSGGQSTTQEEANIGMAQSVGFRNVSEGYTFLYPESWKSQVTEEDTAIWNGEMLPAENVAVFNFVEDQSRNKTPLLALAVYTQDQWQQLKSKSEPLPTVVATKGDRVLAAYTAKQNPYRPDSLQGQQFAKRVLAPGQLQSAITW
ncbi:hypothetical protein [Phytohalomonas tamaricis]|uniref:hypothetical protein n=1 Tax=Phytohalomonas tamaricis TaxID=2081032 RepID=UPI000D0BC918|nr:hypothetical protein [Phytohalomonas tamaricis]